MMKPLIIIFTLTFLMFLCFGKSYTNGREERNIFLRSLYAFIGSIMMFAIIGFPIMGVVYFIQLIFNT